MTKNAALAKIHKAVEDTAVLAFEDMGFTVTPIPRSNEQRTADLLVERARSDTRSR